MSRRDPEVRKAYDRERQRKRRAENRELVLKNQRRWRAANPDRIREHTRKWLTENKDRRNAERLASGYGCWRAMNSRCLNPNTSDYASYGATGITVCDEWRGPGGFERFMEHIGPRPSPQHSIDRWPDPAGNYEPGNVRWATRSEQNRNRRPFARKSALPHKHPEYNIAGKVAA